MTKARIKAATPPVSDRTLRSIWAAQKLTMRRTIHTVSGRPAAVARQWAELAKEAS